MEQNYITLLDVRYFSIYRSLWGKFRKPSIPLLKLRNHQDNVNAIAWAPQSAVHMCSVGDDCKAYIWDLSANKQNEQTPLL